MFVVHLWVGICVFVGREREGFVRGGGSFKFVVVCVSDIVFVGCLYCIPLVCWLHVCAYVPVCMGLCICICVCTHFLSPTENAKFPNCIRKYVSHSLFDIWQLRGHVSNRSFPQVDDKHVKGATTNKRTGY